ncbi:MAG: hypothetical protein QOF65_2674 [Thermoleophilaceae bacterium]|jgi:hypothetical protein|nr:hypothetical protein [Thermoleophilaceae bacterium]
MTRVRIIAVSLAVALGIGLPAAVDAATSVKAPKSGKFKATTAVGKHPVTLYISGKSIQLIAIEFRCKETLGRTSINDIKLTKTKRGYKFSIAAHGIVSYADEGTDENGAIGISGRFAKGGNKVTGVLHVKTPRCGGTGNLKWGGAR